MISGTMRSQGKVYIVLKVFYPLLVVSVLSKKHHDCLYLGTVTIIGPDGEPMCIPQSQIAQVQRGQIKPGPDGTITVLGADGRPVKIPASAVDTPVSSALKFIPTAGRNT